MASRFVEADEEFIEELRNTSEDYWTNIFQQWAKTRGKNEQIESYEVPDLIEALDNFALYVINNDDEGWHSQVQGAYAQSGPPAANGTDGAAEQEIEEEAAIPTYAVVDKSKKSKKQADEKPPEYAVVDKSKKKEKQEAAAIPTYADVDKSKKKKKSREEVPAVYAEVDKSKKKKKKKIDDKNLYENLDEPKKERVSRKLSVRDRSYH